MRNRHAERSVLWLAVLLSAASAGCLTPKIPYDDAGGPRSGAAVPEEQRGRFLLYTGDRKVPGDLESTARLYRRADGAEVLLLAMVHFADRAFYDAVARSVAASDVVLYEGSADAVIAGSAVPERATADATEIFDALDLVPQPDGDGIGPPGPRYVRGDVDKADLAARVEAVRRSGAAWSPQEFPHGLFAWDRFWYSVVGRGTTFRRVWRHAFATRLRPMEEKTIRDILIEPRNEAVLAHVDLEADRPRAARRLRIAVPWGSEHMAGIERGLLARGYVPASVERVVAWRVRSYE